jgi:dTDP-4-amino-4,6-dideoxygalactose transaminase
MGEKVKNFEKQFSEFIGVRYAIGVNSGTSALEIILRTLSVGGKSVIIPTITFMATPLAAIHAGAKVIFVDVLPDNLSIDPIDLEKKIRDDTVAVIPVHIGGIISSLWADIEQICKENELIIVEDAAHAHGALIDGRMAGTLGVAGAFSFYPTKILTTAEGGMITTNNEEIHSKSLILREHGKKDPKHNLHTELGYNWRFSEIHALLGLLEMEKCDSIIRQRRHLAKLYDTLLENVVGLKCVSIPENIVSPYYKYIVYLDNKFQREEIKLTLKNDFNITLPGEVYSDPCHMQPVFKKYPELILNDPGDPFTGAEYVSAKQICLPLYPSLTDDELIYVVNSLKAVLRSLD